MDIAEKTLQLKQDIDDVYEAGKRKKYDEFWDTFQQNGNRNNYRFAFYNGVWNDTTYNPKYPMIITSQCSQMYEYAKMTDTLVPITISAAGQGQVFRNSSIKTIHKLVLTENVTFNQWFDNTPQLENISIEGVIGNDISFKDSTLLSYESIISIIRHLSDNVGATLTLSKAAVNEAFRIDAGDPSTYPEGSEFYILRNSKSNWTFNYL